MRLSGARLLAWTGGAVTLVGVALLLVLAASRGWFSPPVRIGAGAVLGVALVGLSVWLKRKDSARAGAFALAATGFATLYLVVAAASAIYGYLDAVPALLLALLVGTAGLGTADRWRSQLLGAAVVVGAALLAPVLATDWLLVALVLALQLAALPVVLRRRWSVLALVAAAGPVLFGSAVGAVDVADGDAPTIAVVLATLVIGLATAAAAARRLPREVVAALVASTPVPVLVAGAVLGGWGGGALAAVAALALAAVAARPGTDDVIRIVAGSAAALALFQATFIALEGSAATVVVLAQAIVAAVLAAVLRARFPLFVAMIVGAFGVMIAVLRDAPLPLEFPTLPYVDGDEVRTGALLTAVGVSVLVLVLALALLAAGGRIGLIRPDSGSAWLWVPIGLVGLYGATSVAVTLALLVSPDRLGFTAGHALVTVSWAVVALVLLARGISRPALRITGLVLVAAAVAKLVLFDLVALDGLARVAAFLGAGLVLLAAGTRYARLVAEAENAGPADAGGRVDGRRVDGRPPPPVPGGRRAGRPGPPLTTGRDGFAIAHRPGRSGPGGSIPCHARGMSTRYACAVHARRVELRARRADLTGDHRVELRSCLALSRLAATADTAAALAGLAREVAVHIDAADRAARERLPARLAAAVDDVAFAGHAAWAAALRPALRRIATERSLSMPPGWPRLPAGRPPRPRGPPARTGPSGRGGAGGSGGRGRCLACRAGPGRGASAARAARARRNGVGATRGRCRGGGRARHRSVPARGRRAGPATAPCRRGARGHPLRPRHRPRPPAPRRRAHRRPRPRRGGRRRMGRRRRRAGAARRRPSGVHRCLRAAALAACLTSCRTPARTVGTPRPAGPPPAGTAPAGTSQIATSPTAGTPTATAVATRSSLPTGSTSCCSATSTATHSPTRS